MSKYRLKTHTLSRTTVRIPLIENPYSFTKCRWNQMYIEYRCPGHKAVTAATFANGGHRVSWTSNKEMESEYDLWWNEHSTSRRRCYRRENIWSFSTIYDGLCISRREKTWMRFLFGHQALRSFHEKWWTMFLFFCFSWNGHSSEHGVCAELAKKVVSNQKGVIYRWSKNIGLKNVNGQFMNYRRRMSLSSSSSICGRSNSSHWRGTMISVEALCSVLTPRPFGLLWLRVHSERECSVIEMFAEWAQSIMPRRWSANF